MKLPRALSIRANLALLVAVCLLPAMVAAAGILVYHYQQQRAQLVSETVTSVRALTVSVDTELAAAQTILEVLATSPYLENQDLAAFHAQATQALTRSVLNNVALIAPGGQQMMNTAQPWGLPLPKTGVAAQVERVLSTGQPEVSDLSIGALLKRPLISVAVPVHAGQTVAYVLTGVILPTRLQKIISASSQSAERIVAIFDKSGIIAARSHEPERFIGKSVAPGLAARLKEVNEDTIEVFTLEGIPVISVFSRSGVSGWGAALGIPTQVLTAGLRHSMWQLATATTLLLSLGLGLAWLMGGRISRVVGQLVQPALNLALGKAVNVPELPITEADELGRSLMLTSVVLESTTNALKSSETRMRSILQSAMDAIITVDDQQKVVLFNAAASAMFACPAEQALGRPVTMFIPERFHAQHLAYIEKNRVPSDGSEVFGIAGVAVGLRSGGEEFPLEVSYSNVVAPDGIFHTLIIRDITTRVQSFQALERSNLDLQQFAYVASHDLKTPLRSISGFVQILERNYADKLDDNGLALIRRTALAASRLEQLTEDMLSFARVNSDPRPFAPVNSLEVVEEAVHLLDALIQSTSASVTMGDLPAVMGDRTQLVQLFLNLLGNSLKYCQGRAPVVHVSAIREGNEWVFSVADNGIGIEPKHHQKIFEIFKRLHTQNEYAGTGIGLAVCHRIVERHRGKIWVESSIGEGSTFRFTFPINSGATP
ncbi:MAG: ATP-binding protein [Polaromonas sp.]